MHLSNRGSNLSHILFADNVLLFREVIPQQVKVVMDTLVIFSKHLKVYMAKSKAMCYKRVSSYTRKVIKCIYSILFTK